MLKLSRVWVAAVALALFADAPALADIRAFSAKVQARDYKGAAAEAAATWRTLDKSRKDIAIVANEFGFWTYLAGDFSEAQTFAMCRLAHSQRSATIPLP